MTEGGRNPFEFLEEQISGKLLGDKLVIGLVGIESTDDVVAIRFRHVDAIDGGDLGLALDVACHVEPVASPPFAVVRGTEEALGEKEVGLVKSAGFNRGLEGVEFGESWWEAGQVERETTGEGEWIGFRIGAQADCSEGVENEEVYLVTGPRGIAENGSGRFG